MFSFGSSTTSLTAVAPVLPAIAAVEAPNDTAPVATACLATPSVSSLASSIGGFDCVSAGIDICGRGADRFIPDNPSCGGELHHVCRQWLIHSWTVLPLVPYPSWLPSNPPSFRSLLFCDDRPLWLR